MSSRNPIAYVDMRVFAHATEDLDKVMNAIRNTLPTESSDTIVFKKANLTGYHGNSIVLFETRIKERSAVQAVFKKLSSGFSIMDKELLSGEIPRHLEKGSLYIRLDKQSAYLNELKLGPKDSIHVKIHFKKHRPEEIVDICRKFGLLP